MNQLLNVNSLSFGAQSIIEKNEHQYDIKTLAVEY